MSDLIDQYQKSGLISDPTRYFRPCCGCGERFHPDELNTVDVESYGEHDTIEVCDECSSDFDSPANKELSNP